MPAIRAFPMLSVANLTQSLDFYQRRLGGAESYRFPSNGPPVFVTLRFGETEIGLAQLGPTPPLHGQPLRPATGHRVELCMYVDDVDAVVSALRAEGARVLLEPSDQPWGERVAYVADPDDNLVMLTK